MSVMHDVSRLILRDISHRAAQRHKISLHNDGHQEVPDLLCPTQETTVDRLHNQMKVLQNGKEVAVQSEDFIAANRFKNQISDLATQIRAAEKAEEADRVTMPHVGCTCDCLSTCAVGLQVAAAFSCWSLGARAANQMMSAVLAAVRRVQVAFALLRWRQYRNTTNQEASALQRGVLFRSILVGTTQTVGTITKWRKASQTAIRAAAATQQAVSAAFSSHLSALSASVRHWSQLIAQQKKSESRLRLAVVARLRLAWDAWCGQAVGQAQLELLVQHSLSQMYFVSLVVALNRWRQNADDSIKRETTVRHACNLSCHFNCASCCAITGIGELVHSRVVDAPVTGYGA